MLFRSPMNPFHTEEKKEEEPVKVINDKMQIAWENFEAARLISERELAKMTDDASNKENVMRTLGHIFMRLGDLLVFEGKIEEGILEYKKALEIRESSKEQNERDLAETYCSLGTAYASIEKKSEALENLNNSKKLISGYLAKILNISTGSDDYLINAFVDSSNQAAKKCQEVLIELTKKVIFVINEIDKIIR